MPPSVSICLTTDTSQGSVLSPRRKFTFNPDFDGSAKRQPNSRRELSECRGNGGFSDHLRPETFHVRASTIPNKPMSVALATRVDTSRALQVLNIKKTHSAV